MNMTLLNKIGVYDVHQTEPMTQHEYLQQHYTDVVQKYMNDTVKAKGYDDVFTCISYVNSTDETFRAEANKVLRWRDLVWRTCYEILADVEAGNREIPQDVIAELPKLEW